MGKGVGEFLATPGIDVVRVRVRVTVKGAVKGKGVGVGVGKCVLAATGIVEVAHVHQGQKVKANRAILRTTHARIREYQKSTPWGSVLVVGDLSVCLSNNLDTDRPDLHTDADEPEAEVLRTFMQEAERSTEV